MKHSIKVGVSFGITSGIITTLGLMVGLYSSTESRIIVIGGILIIAIADALSDAFGIHMSEESENRHTQKQIWASTFSTFLAKFILALSFIIPVLLFELKTAVIVAVIYGLFALSVLSFNIAKRERKKPSKIIIEHLIIGIVVIIITYFVGRTVNIIFV